VTVLCGQDSVVAERDHRVTHARIVVPKSGDVTHDKGVNATCACHAIAKQDAASGEHTRANRIGIRRGVTKPRRTSLRRMIPAPAVPSTGCSQFRGRQFRGRQRVNWQHPGSGVDLASSEPDDADRESGGCERDEGYYRSDGELFLWHL